LGRPIQIGRRLQCNERLGVRFRQVGKCSQHGLLEPQNRRGRGDQIVRTADVNLCDGSLDWHERCAPAGMPYELPISPGPRHRSPTGARPPRRLSEYSLIVTSFVPSLSLTGRCDAPSRLAQSACAPLDQFGLHSKYSLSSAFASGAPGRRWGSPIKTMCSEEVWL
jgi:hypothetical protein